MGGRLFSSTTTLTFLIFTTVAFSNEWPGFRGPDLTGKIEGRGTFHGKGNVTLDAAWNIEIGSGYSGISIADGRAITAYAEGEHNVLAAFDSKTGKKLWQVQLGPIYKGHDGSHDGPIATPYIHDGIVYMYNTDGLLLAVNAADGKDVWRKMLPEQYTMPQLFYGYGSSPIMYDNKLILTVGGENQAVMAFNPKNGELIWQQGSERIGYQSVLPWTYQNQKVLLVTQGKYLFALNPDDGKPQWTWFHDGTGAALSTMPIPVDKDRIFLASKTNTSSLVKLGAVKAAETPKATGEEAPAEGAEAEPKPSYPTVETTLMWEDKAIRKSYNIPVYHDGYIYAYSTRFLTCVDPNTGEPMWRSRPPGDGFLTMVDGHMVILTKRGAVHVAKASPKDYMPVAELPLFDETSWNLPSFAEGSIFVRSMGRMARVNIVEGSAVASSDASGENAATPSAFQSLLADLNKLNGKASKTKRIEAFFAKHPQTPLIEADGRVTFLYHGAAEDVALASEIFGARQERGMQRVPETNLFYYVVDMPNDAVVHYHFIKDFNDQLIDPRNPKQSETVTYDGFMGFNTTGDPLAVSMLVMPEFQVDPFLAKAAKMTPAPMREHEIDSQKLDGLQNINVLTPPDYDANSDKRYPVVYVLDGQMVSEQLYWGKMLPQLMGNKIAEGIFVFIKVPANDNPKFNAYLAEELVPFVDGNYRTIAEANQRTIVGVGFVGSQVLQISLNHPETFARAAAHSPWVIDSTLTAIEGTLPNLGEVKPHIYLDWGAYDIRNSQENWDTRRYSKTLVDMLNKAAVPVTVKTFNDGTGLPAWRNRAMSLLTQILPPKS